MNEVLRRMKIGETPQEVLKREIGGYIAGGLNSGDHVRDKRMIAKSRKSIELYHIMLKRGYPEVFCDEVTKNLNTDWTAQRMIGYLSHYKKLPMEEVADEMLAILSDRNRLIQKHELEATNAKWNEYLNRDRKKEE